LQVLFLLYDVSDQQSFIELRNLIDSIKGIPPKDCLKVLVGNKVDLNGQRQVSPQEGSELARQLGIGFFEVSSLNNRAQIINLFEQVGRSEITRSA